MRSISVGRGLLKKHIKSPIGFVPWDEFLSLIVDRFTTYLSFEPSACVPWAAYGTRIGRQMDAPDARYDVPRAC